MDKRFKIRSLDCCVLFVAILFSVMTGVVLVSCTDGVFTDNVDNTSLESLIPDTWQAQVEYGKNNNLNTRSDVDMELPRLVQETYLGKIKSQAEISQLIEELFADDAVTVLYTIDYSDFDILQVKDVKDAIKKLGAADYLEEIKTRLNTRVTVGMDLIKLEWSFRGKKYYTTAIASNNLGGIIYDAIGSAIIARRESDTQSMLQQENVVPVLKTKSENNESIQRFYRGDTGYSLLGSKLWSYSIIVRSKFNGAGILCDKDLEAEGLSHDFLWSCKADAKTLSGELNRDTYHEFAWGCVYGMGSVSLSFGGSGFTVSGGSSNCVGTEIHHGV